MIQYPIFRYFIHDCFFSFFTVFKPFGFMTMFSMEILSLEIEREGADEYPNQIIQIALRTSF